MSTGELNRGLTALLVKKFVPDYEQTEEPRVRGRYGALAGWVGICCNVLLCAAKLVVGILSGSVAITADGVNNLTDALSSILTLLGFHISQKPPDDDHPYGHARMEYLTGLAIAALIVVIGVELGKTSIEKIIAPSPVEFSAALVTVLVLSIGVKLWMGMFGRSLGRRIHSGALLAIATDSRNDAISTSAVLLAAIITRISGVDLDGYMGLGVALFILYSGVGVAKETIKPLLGAPPDPQLVKMVGRETLNFDPRVLGFHDLVVHDYGPGQCFASIHAEIDHRLDPLEAHELLDDIERMFREKHHIQLVIHYDPIVTDDAELNRMQAYVRDKLAVIHPCLRLHDFRMVRGAEHTNFIFDLVIPHELRGREKELQARLNELVQHEDMKYYTVITFDTDGFNQG